MKEQDRNRADKHPPVQELSGEQYRNIVEQLNDALYIIDFKGNILYCNLNAARMIGYSREELSGAHLSKLDSAGSVAEFQERMGILMKESAVFFEVEHIRKDGSAVPVEVDVKLVSREGKGLIHCFVRDITQRKQAEKALIQSQTDLLELFDNAPVGYHELDMEGRIFRINHTELEMMGYTSAEMLGRYIWEFVLDEEKSEAAVKAKLAGRLPPSSGQERVFQRKDGTNFPAIIEERLLFNLEGQIRGIRTVIEDVTERKRAEEQIHCSERALKKAQSVARVGSWTWNIKQNSLEWSDEMYRIFGIARESFTGSITDVIARAIHPEDRLRVDASNQSVVEQKTPVALEYRIIWPDGSIHTVWAEAGELILDESGAPAILTGIVQEITERKQAEEALRESEKRFATLSEAAFEGIVISDKGQVVDCNEQLAEMLGYERSKVIGLEAVNFVAPESMETVRRHIQSGSEESYEHLSIRKDGTKFPVEVHAKSLPYKGKEMRVTVIRDITERKRAVEELMVSEEKFRKAFSSSPMITGISRLADGCYLDVNDNFTKMLGWERQEIIGRTSSELGIFCDYSQREKMAAHVKEHGSIRNHEVELKTKSGEIRVTEFSAELIDIEGEKCLLAQINDITERKQAEEALRESEIKYYSLFNQSVEGIYLHDFNGRIIDVNLMACIQSGYSREELLERTVFDLHPQPAEAPVQSRQEIINQWQQWQPEERHSLEAAHQRKDGTVFPVQISTGIIRYGEEDLLLAIVRDISERKQAENEIHALNQELEQRIAERTAHLEAANQELEAFAYSISHDLRTPLRHINGFVNLLHERLTNKLDEESEEDLETVIAATNHMGALIDDLLSFSRMGRQDMSQANVNLGELVREVIHDLKAETEGRKIEWRIAKLATVTGDRAMLRIVLFNLLANAVKYTRPRQAARIEIGSGKSEKGETVIFVRDNGVGFDMRYADKLFGVFQRLHRIDEFEGTGIGLANVRRIINRHGGRTWGEGEIDKGATFYFSLPKEG